MIDQFEAEKCPQAESTDNFVLMIINKRPNPWATPEQPPGNSDVTNPGTQAESRCKNPGSAPRGGGCWCLELTDVLF